MKRILSLIAVFFLLTSNLFAANIPIDYMEYATDVAAQAAWVTNSSGSESVDQEQTTADLGEAGPGDVGDLEYKVGQSFQLSAALTVSAVEIKQLDKTGSPTGNWVVRIETDNAGVPSGTLANANASVTVTPPGDATIIKGTFATPFALSGSTLYWIVVSGDAQSTNNYWRLGRTGQNYANGNAAEWAGADPWFVYTGTRDLYFKVYVTTISYLQSYSEGTIKTQGSYSLKGVAAITDSLNKTLTHTVSPTINLSDQTLIRFDERTSRTGSNIKVGFHDSGGTTTETTPNQASADTYQTNTVDISAVSNANKDAIDSVIITITNADSANTIYFDNMFDSVAGTDIFGVIE